MPGKRLFSVVPVRREEARLPRQSPRRAPVFLLLQAAASMSFSTNSAFSEAEVLPIIPRRLPRWAPLEVQAASY